MSEPGPSMRAFGERDGDLADLAGRTIAFVGYGNQGRAQALNLRDSLRHAQSGVADIVVGAPRDESLARAEADGFTVCSVADAAQRGDVLLLLIPDEVLPPVFEKEIAPHLQPNDALVFASGYNLAFEAVTPPSNVDVLLLAPRMIGRQLRKLYEQGQGFYTFVSVEQDASGRAWSLLLGLAKGIGTLSAGGGALQLSARDETLLDLYMEQGFGAVIGALVLQTLQVGREAGIPAEALILELYLSGEMAQTFQAMAELGFYEQSSLHSLTSQYGGMTRNIRFAHEPIRQHLERAIEEIRSGAFAREWAAERESGYENFDRLRELGRNANPFTPIEERLRAALREAQERAAKAR